MYYEEIVPYRAKLHEMRNCHKHYYIYYVYNILFETITQYYIQYINVSLKTNEVGCHEKRMQFNDNSHERKRFLLCYNTILMHFNRRTCASKIVQAKQIALNALNPCLSALCISLYKLYAMMEKEKARHVYHNNNIRHMRLFVHASKGS